MNITVNTTENDFYKKYLGLLNGILKLSEREMELGAVILKMSQDKNITKEELAAVARNLLNLSRPHFNQLMDSLIRKKFLAIEEDLLLINKKVYIKYSSTQEIVFKLITV